MTIKTLLQLVLLTLFVFPHSLWAEASKPLSVKLFSHRGLTSAYPENSLEALTSMIHAGIHGVEVDLRTTQDGHIVIMHDEILDRTSTGSGPVRKTTWDQIKQFRLKDKAGKPTQCKIPDFDGVLEQVKAYPAFELALDLKDVDAVKVAQMVVQHNMTGQVTFFVADPMNTALAQSITAVAPDLRITVDMLTWWKIEDVPLFAARALHADTLFASEWFFPKRGFSSLKKDGVPVIVYLWGTHDLKKRFLHAVELGADSVSCDNPLELLSLVKPSTYGKNQE